MAGNTATADGGAEGRTRVAETKQKKSPSLSIHPFVSRAAVELAVWMFVAAHCQLTTGVHLRVGWPKERNLDRQTDSWQLRIIITGNKEPIGFCCRCCRLSLASLISLQKKKNERVPLATRRQEEEEGQKRTFFTIEIRVKPILHRCSAVEITVIESGLHAAVTALIYSSHWWRYSD